MAEEKERVLEEFDKTQLAGKNDPSHNWMALPSRPLLPNPTVRIVSQGLYLRTQDTKTRVASSPSSDIGVKMGTTCKASV